MKNKTYIFISIITLSILFILIYNNRLKHPKLSDNDSITEEFIIKDVQGCNLTVVKDDNTYSVSLCNFDELADEKLEISDKIRIKYSEVLEIYPPVIIAEEYEIIK